MREVKLIENFNHWYALIELEALMILQFTIKTYTVK